MITWLVQIGPWVLFIFSLFGSLHFLSQTTKVPNRGALIIMGVVWVCLVQAEGLFFGPFSRLEWGDGDRLFTGYFPWLAEQGDSIFLMNLMGGVDRYGLGRIGGELFSIRLILLQYLPLWAVIALSRLIVPLVALIGIYLFSRRLLRCPIPLAFALGALYAVGFDFTATLTFLYGISLAGIPLLLYFLFSGKNDVRSWGLLILFGIGYIGTADPIYWLPAIWVTVVVVSCWTRPRSKSFICYGLVIFTVFWLINYSELIYAFWLMLPWSARGTTPLYASSLWSHMDWLMSLPLGYNHPGPLFTIPLLFALTVGIWGKSRTPLWAALTSLLLGFSVLLLARVPWDQLGLSFLTTYRWYWEYAALSIALLAAAAAGGALRGTSSFKLTSDIATAITVALAVAMTGVLKIETLLQTMTRGNLASLTDIPNLRTPQWRQDTQARVVSLPGLIDTNSMVNYGFPTYDGGATLVSGAVNTYWNQVMLEDPKNSREALGFGFHEAFNQCCDPLEIDQLVDVNLLRLAGVRYLLSYRPIISVHLMQVDGPADVKQPRKLRDIFGSPAPVFVYEVDKPLPRVWWASQIRALDQGASIDETFRLLKTYALAGAAVVSPNDALNLEAAQAKGPVEIKMVQGGIDLLTNGQGGTLLINQEWLPWWTATTNFGEILKPYKANTIHMALSIPSGTQSVNVRYQRPLFRDLILDFF